MPDSTPLDCTDLKAIVSAFVDDELDDARRHDAERHIADCATCRALVDEAERIDDLVGREVAAWGAHDSLPEGFVGSILARTVHDVPAPHARRWTNWVGWLAAAAALALAVTAWVAQRGGIAPPDRNATNAETGALRVLAANYRPTGRSWVLDAPTPDMHRTDDQARAPHDADSSSAGAVDASALPRLASDDRDSVHAAALLIATIADADIDSFADLEQVRRIAVYDDVLPRLRAARAHVAPVDRASVLAAEALLLRAVRGPFDQSDLQELRDTAAGSELADTLFRIGGASGWSV